MDKHLNEHVDKHEWLAEQFEGYRAHLRTVAYRLLGSMSEADDAVQESWFRLSRSDTGDVTNLGGWLTTVVARVCLDMLRARASRREEPMAVHMPEPIQSREDGIDPEREALLADAVGLALLVVLDTLGPAERLAFVLHDLFDVPFDEIAPIVGRTPAAARQLASRARRRIQRQGATAITDANFTLQRTVVNAFLAASRAGDFDALLAVLDPDAVVRTDGAGILSGAAAEVQGAPAVARYFLGRAQAAHPALINGAVGLVWALNGQPRVIFDFTITGGNVVAINMVADPTRLRQYELAILSVNE